MPLKKTSLYLFPLVLFYLLLLFSSCYSPYYTKDNLQDENLYLDEAKALINDPPLEFKVSIYLTDRYHSGNCSGMPGPPPQGMIKKTLKDNPVLVDYIRLKYKIQGEYYIFEKINQIKKFKLKKINKGYMFSFVNGQCCKIYQNKGIIYIENDEIVDCEITESVVYSMPC